MILIISFSTSPFKQFIHITNEFQGAKSGGHLSVLIFLELSEAFKAVGHSLLYTHLLLTIMSPFSPILLSLQVLLLFLLQVLPSKLDP